MSETVFFSCVMIIAVFISSVSQVLLKKSAQRTYSSRIREYLNPLVIVAYMMFFGCTLMSIYAFRGVRLLYFPVLESSGYIFVTVFSYLFFKERLTKRQILGLALIIVGIVLGTIANMITGN